VTKFAPVKCLKPVSLGKFTFDERAVLFRVVRLWSAPQWGSIQGYLARKKLPPPQDRPRALGVGLL